MLLNDFLLSFRQQEFNTAVAQLGQAISFAISTKRTYSKYLDSGSEFELSVLLGIQWLAF